MRSRLDTLIWLYEEAEEALREAPADRKSALIGQLRMIAAEIDELTNAQDEKKDAPENPLEQMLAKRRAKRTG